MSKFAVGAVSAALVWSGLTGAAPAAAELTIRGVDAATVEVLTAFVTIDELPCDAPRWWVERRHRQADDEIHRGMEALGYYQATEQGSLTWGENCWHASYEVSAGDPVRVQAFDLVIEGALQDEPRMRAAVIQLAIAPEEPFSHRAYEDAKGSLLDAANDLGYLDAEFVRHRVEVHPETNEAFVELTLAGGERYRIGRIEVQQQALTDELFQKYIEFHVGDPYDGQALTRTYRGLLASDYFDRILVTPELDSRANGEVSVVVGATANTRRSSLVGAGYATDTGPRLRLDLRYRRVNEQGHRATINTLVSPVTGEVGAEYRIPYGKRVDQWLFVKGDINYQDTDTSKSVEREITFGRTHRRGKSWAETNYLEFTEEEFEVGDQEGTSQLLLFGTSWARTTGVDVPRPRSGYSVSLDVRGALQALLSDNDLLQVIGRARKIVPLGSRVRLLGRVQAGWSWLHEFDELPPSVRFFAGGDSSVRGYAYESLGPEDDGEVVGGRRLLTGSLEVDTLVRRNWSLAAFVDTGSAFDDRPDFSTAVGIGLRWYSPLGPLRLDLAHPLDDPDKSLRVHITLGPDL